MVPKFVQVTGSQSTGLAALDDQGCVWVYQGQLPTTRFNMRADVSGWVLVPNQVFAKPEPVLRKVK